VTARGRHVKVWRRARRLPRARVDEACVLDAHVDLQRIPVRIPREASCNWLDSKHGMCARAGQDPARIARYAPVAASYVYATVTHSPASYGTMYSVGKHCRNLTFRDFDTHSRLLLESAPVFWYVRPLIFLDRMMIENPPLDDGGIQLGNAGWKAGPRPLSW
jgi:hypothetical protein